MLINPVQYSLFIDQENLSLKKRKEIFLKSLLSQKRDRKYKRYLGTPLRYAGGKSLAVGFIVEALPDDVERIISPFLGGASFEIACVKELKIPVIASDIFDLLINYWEIQINQPDELAERLSKFKPTREEFTKVKERLKQHWKGLNKIEDKVELAALYFFNHNTSYGPGFLSWPSSVYLQEKRYKSMIEKVKSTRLNNITVFCDTFENVIQNYPNDFLYCDPPYFLEGDSKMFRGIYPQRNFPIHHNNFNHKLLHQLLLNHRGKFILSYNDCSVIREWYKDFEIIDVRWQYTLGQGETRIGANRMRDNRNHIKESHEILIVKR